MSGLILHHYWSSNFAEKIRLTLGFKGLSWASVEIPSIAPKPDYEPLTAGYRRTPALQIGADVWCDTHLISAYLERTHPHPSLYPGPAPERTRALAAALTVWSEQTFLWPVALYATGMSPHRRPEAFHHDRATLHAKPAAPLAKVRAAAERSVPTVRAHLRLLEALLAPPGRFVLGDAPSAADLALYHVVWFLRRGDDPLGLADGHPRIGAWAEQVANLGHGHWHSLAAEDALARAKASTPERLDRQALAVSPSPLVNPAGLEPGEPVSVEPMTEISPAHGTLVAMDEERVVIASHGERTGEVHVHFPREGYRVRRAT